MHDEHPIFVGAVLFFLSCLSTMYAFDIRTSGGRVFYEVRKVQRRGTSLKIYHRDGISRSRMEDFPDSERKKIGLPTRTELRKAREEKERRRRKAEERRRAFEAEQRAKGLVLYAGKWVTLNEKERLEKEKLIDSIVMSKARRNVSYKVIQALDDGLLCVAESWDRLLGPSYTGEVFFLVGPTRELIADGEQYRDDLYWTGSTYTYVTVSNVQKTVNMYCPSRQVAEKIVRIRFDEESRMGGDEGEEKPRHPPGAGSYASGFLITEDGYLLTAAHVVGDRESAEVSFSPRGAKVSATVVATDENSDVALLKIDSIQKFNPVRFSSMPLAKLGQTVFTVGFPLPDIQGFEPKVTKGIISAMKGIQDDVRTYQIDAAIQPGNSGGPLVDEFGNVVGMLVAKLDEARLLLLTGVVPQNVNYALKKPYVLEFLSDFPKVVDAISVGDDKPMEFEEAVERVRNSTVLVE